MFFAVMLPRATRFWCSTKMLNQSFALCSGVSAGRILRRPFRHPQHYSGICVKQRVKLKARISVKPLC
jgi:hypothetical protein